MATVSVTSKGQVTIPKAIRDRLGITTCSQVEFELVGDKARMRLARRGKVSSIDDGPAILNYRGPRIATAELDGAVAMKKMQHARR
jgi:AbrB family looped-hinge helix DNA binding protein